MQIGCRFPSASNPHGTGSHRSRIAEVRILKRVLCVCGANSTVNSGKNSYLIHTETGEQGRTGPQAQTRGRICLKPASVLAPAKLFGGKVILALVWGRSLPIAGWI